jgi:hypothetical protein
MGAHLRRRINPEKTGKIRANPQLGQDCSEAGDRFYARWDRPSNRGREVDMGTRSRAHATVLAGVMMLAGCSYLETQLQRAPTPDTRIQLDWNERRHLYGREIPSYTCRGNYLLQCERGVSVTYSCTCVLP